MNLFKISNVDLTEQQSNDQLFHVMVKSVLFIMFCINIPICLYLSAKFCVLSALIGSVIFIPMIIYLDRKQQGDSARILFIILYNCFLFTSSAGAKHQVMLEYYCFPSMMLGLLLFDLRRVKLVAFGIVAAILTWLMIHLEVMPPYPSDWAPTYLPLKTLNTLTFILTFMLMTTFLRIFIQTSNRRRMIEIQTLGRANGKAIQVAKLASLGDMAGGISHEINNPLAIISMGISVLSKTEVGSEKYKQKIESINTAIDRITKIVQGLKKFSSSKNEVFFKMENLSEIVKDSMFLFEAKAQKFQIPIILNLLSDAQILCDEVGVEQLDRCYKK